MLVATESAVYALECSGRQVPPEVLFRGEGVRRVAREGHCSVVAMEGGRLAVYRNSHLERVSTGIAEPVHSLLILETDPLRLLIGTEPPHVYRMEVGNGEAERVESFEKLDCRDGWHTPWGGPPALRSLARSAGGWVYADIHVGSIMRSPDRGATWEPVTPDLDEDVHQVATSPKEIGRIYANTARAVYLSEDRGGSWTHRADGLPARYGRAIAVHPADPDCLLASVSEGPGGNVRGRLFRTENAGRTWTHVTDGFPETTRGNIDTFHLAFSPDGAAWAASDRTLYRSPDRGRTWKTAWEAPTDIALIAVP